MGWICESVAGSGGLSAGSLGGWVDCDISWVLVLAADEVLLLDLLKPALILAAGLFATVGALGVGVSFSFCVPICWMACWIFSSASLGVRLESTFWGAKFKPGVDSL